MTYVNPPRVMALAREQSGVATRRQLLEAGLSYRSQRLRLTAGQWSELFGCLVVLPADPALQRATAIRLRMGEDAVITGPLAIQLHRLAGLVPERVAGCAMAVVPPTRHDCAPDLRVIRDTVDRKIVQIAGVGVASALDAISDCAMYLDYNAGQEIVDRALLKGVITVDDLARCTATRAVTGRNGSAQLRRILRSAQSGTRFEAERRLRPLLRSVRGARWRHNVPVCIGGQHYVLDVMDEELRICLEVDGRAYHSDSRSFEADRARQNALVVDGWVVLRFTWAQITRGPERVIADIQAAVDQTAADGRRRKLA
jgi:very-short-patch-repair endonuclease